jgi:hypothetical protein
MIHAQPDHLRARIHAQPDQLRANEISAAEMKNSAESVNGSGPVEK